MTDSYPYSYIFDFGSFRCTDPECCLEVWGYVFDCPLCNFDDKLQEKYCSHPPEAFSPMNDYELFEETVGQTVKITCPNCAKKFESDPFVDDIDELKFKELPHESV
jgi:hypothetical protein